MLTCPPQPGPSPEGSHLRRPLSLTRLPPVAPRHPCLSWSPLHARLFAWSLGRRERCRLLQPDCPARLPSPPPHECDHCSADAPSVPTPAPRQTNLHVFRNCRLFLNKPSLYRTAPLWFTWVPSLPTPLFCWFSTNTAPSGTSRPNPPSM